MLTEFLNEDFQLKESQWPKENGSGDEPAGKVGSIHNGGTEKNQRSSLQQLEEL